MLGSDMRGAIWTACSSFLEKLERKTARRTWVRA
jgi:hypothetical protein